MASFYLRLMKIATTYIIGNQRHQNFKIKGEVDITVHNGKALLLVKKGNECQPVNIQGLNGSVRYTCTCQPSLLSAEREKERFANQVVLRLPRKSLEYERRVKAGMLPTVCIDRCIVEAIKKLWAKGIDTLGCCCGHNVMPGWVQVHPKDYERMFELGYEQAPVVIPKKGQVHGLYSFFL